MIILNQGRCAYCGGCVSVCPAEALSLAETRLLVAETCIECGDCIRVCPVGALSLMYEPVLRPPALLRRSYDLVVVGAGPASMCNCRLPTR